MLMVENKGFFGSLDFSLKVHILTLQDILAGVFFDVISLASLILKKMSAKCPNLNNHMLFFQIKMFFHEKSGQFSIQLNPSVPHKRTSTLFFY